MTKAYLQHRSTRGDTFLTEEVPVRANPRANGSIYSVKVPYVGWRKVRYGGRFMRDTYVIAKGEKIAVQVLI